MPDTYPIPKRAPMRLTVWVCPECGGITTKDAACRGAGMDHPRREHREPVEYVRVDEFNYAAGLDG